MELGHNPLRLISRKLIAVKNARAAQDLLSTYCEGKRDRGFRLRVVACLQTNTVELGGRQSLPVRMAVRLLKDAGLYVKEIAFKDNTLVKRV